MLFTGLSSLYWQLWISLYVSFYAATILHRRSPPSSIVAMASYRLAGGPLPRWARIHYQGTEERLLFLINS
jgi:hypothetical protein